MTPRDVRDVCLQVRHVDVGYSATPILSGFSMQASYGEVVRIRGANGTGKTTLLRAIAGMVELRSGQILINGCCLQGMLPDAIARQHNVGYLQQHRRGVPGVTVAANLTLASWHAGSYRKAESMACKILERGEYSALAALREAQASSLSGGQRLLLSLAMLTIRAPKLLLLDEPMAGADLTLRSIVLHTVRGWAEQSRCVLIVDHEGITDSFARPIDIPPLAISS